MGAFKNVRQNYRQFLVLTPLFLLAIALAHRFSPTQASELVDDLIHTLHSPGFMVVAMVTFFALRSQQPGLKKYIVAATIAMAIAVFAEAAQIPGPRDASVRDLAADAVGVAAGLGLIALFKGETFALPIIGTRLGLASATVVACAVTFFPTLWSSYVLFAQYRAFPAIMTFDERWEHSAFGPGWRGRPELVPAPDNWPVEGDLVASTHESGRWGILLRIQPFPDWSQYSTLSFVAATVNGEPQDVTMSIRDMELDGDHRSRHFYKDITIEPTPSRYTIELGNLQDRRVKQRLDMTHVSTVVFSAAEPGRDNVQVFFDDFRLER